MALEDTGGARRRPKKRGEKAGGENESRVTAGKREGSTQLQNAQGLGRRGKNTSLRHDSKRVSVEGGSGGACPHGGGGPGLPALWRHWPGKERRAGGKQAGGRGPPLPPVHASVYRIWCLQFLFMLTVIAFSSRAVVPSVGAEGARHAELPPSRDPQVRGAPLRRQCLLTSPSLNCRTL